MLRPYRCNREIDHLDHDLYDLTGVKIKLWMVNRYDPVVGAKHPARVQGAGRVNLRMLRPYRCNREIDHLDYDLYDLTGVEIKIVEGGSV